MARSVLAMSEQPLVIDTSALLCRYISDSRQGFVNQLVDQSRRPVVTSAVRVEVTMALHLVTGRAPSHPASDRLWSRFAADWDRFWVVPIAFEGPDASRAAELGATYGLNLSNALHLVGLERVPLPARLLTFDDRQVAAAVDLGFEVAEPEVSKATTAHGLLK